MVLYLEGWVKTNKNGVFPWIWRLFSKCSIFWLIVNTQLTYSELKGAPKSHIFLCSKILEGRRITVSLIFTHNWQLHMQKIVIFSHFGAPLPPPGPPLTAPGGSFPLPPCYATESLIVNRVSSRLSASFSEVTHGLNRTLHLSNELNIEPQEWHNSTVCQSKDL